jgi:predicted ester cyclase
MPHRTGSGAQEVHGPKALRAWISCGLSLMPDLHFSVEVGPIVDGPYLVLRWKAQGAYSGGLPGSAPEAVGRLVSFTGTDTLQVVDGKLAEYWANADSLYFMQQLGVRQIPVLE